VILLLFSLVSTAAALSLPNNVPASSSSSRTTLATTEALQAVVAVAPSNNNQLLQRRNFLLKTTTAAVVAASSIFLPASASAAAATTKNSMTPDAALTQWKAAVVAIDSLLDRNWDDIGGGDAIRKELGTANFGTETSPLFQITKAFKVLRDNDDSISDLVEFTEQSEEFTNALNRADTMAYSANFAGGSGKPTPPKVYIDKAKVEVQDMKRIAKSISSLLLVGVASP